MKGILTMKDMKIMKVGSDQRDGIRDTDLVWRENLPWQARLQEQS